MAASVLSPVPSLGGAGGGSSVHDHICVHGGHEAARAASSTAADSARRWPSHIDTALAWSGPDLDGDEYTYVLSAEDKAEVDGALKIFKDLNLSASEANASNFPLPCLSARLQRLAIELHHGRGFFLLRGLDSNDYSANDNAILFLGLSSHIAPRRGRQDEAGSMLMHIRNAKEMTAPQQDRPARDSNQRLHFHSDMFCDVLALHTRGCAAERGNHMISSATTIYNELAATRPDVLDILGAEEWAFDRRSLHAERQRRALLFNHEGRVMLNYGRNRITGANEAFARRQAAAAAATAQTNSPSSPQPCTASSSSAQSSSSPAVQPITPQQREALELVQQIAEKHQLELVMQRGDLAFINNFALLHARDGFVDTDEAHTRYLVRLWLKNDELAWSLPPVLHRGNVATFDPTARQVWNIMPELRRKFKLREIFSP